MRQCTPRNVGLVLALAGVFCGCMADGFWLLAGAAGRFYKEDAAIEVRPLNFRYLHPGRPWFDAFEKPADARFSIMRLNPAVFVTAYAWEGEDLTRGSDEIAVDLRASLSKEQGAQVVDGGGITVDGHPARRITVRRVVSKQAVVQEHVVLGLGGFGYHLTIWSGADEEAELRALFPELLARFRVLDPLRVSSKVKGEPFRGYASTNVPFALEWTQRPWRAWPDMRKEVEEAETGALTPDGDGGFVVTGFSFVGERPRPEALQKAALAVMSLGTAEDPVRAVPPPAASEGGMQQQEWTAARTAQKDRWFYHGLLRVFPGHAVVTWAWSRTDAATAEARLRIVASGLKHLDAPVAGETPAAVRVSQAFLQNQVALFYYEARQYPLACRWFLGAQKAAPETPVFLRNAVRCLHAARQYQEAITLVEGASPEMAADNVVRSWLAWNLDAAGDHARAADVFKALLAAGHRDDDDMEQYADILESLGRGAEATAAWDGYLSLHGSPALSERYSRFLHRHKRHAAAVDLLQGLLATQYQPSLVYQRMSHLSALERHKEVIDAADELLARGYESAECLAWRGRAEYRLRWYRKAKVSFERALSLDPADKDAKEWLDGVSAMLGEGANSNVKEALQPVALPAALLAEMKPGGATAQDGSSHYDWRVDAVEFERNKSERHTLYRRVRILDDAGVSRFSTLTFNYNADAERIFVNRLVVLDAAGTVVAEGNVDDSYVINQPGRGQASNDMTLHVPVPRLGRGMQLEFIVTREMRGSASRLSFRNISMATSRPSLLTALYYRGDPKDVRTETRHVPAPEPVEGGLLFSLRNVAGLEDEPWAQDATEFEPAVRLVDAGAKWKTLVDEYLARLKPVLADDAGMTQLARELTRGLATPEARVAALLDHVHQGVTYRAIEFGVRGTMPVAGARTLQQGYGDCKDHSVLLVQLLRGIGVNAVLALVHTSAPLAERLPSLDQFDHMIVYLPGSGRFIDPTDRDADPTLTVPSQLGSRQALLLDDRATVARIPAYPTRDPMVQVERVVTVEPQGALQVEETVTWRGYYAGTLRSFLRGKDQAARTAWIEGVVSEQAPGVTVAKSTVAAVEQTRAPLQVRLTYSVPAAAAPEQGTFVLHLPLTWERYYLTLPVVPQRKTPFHLIYPFAIKTSTRLAAPANAALRADASASMNDKNASSACRVLHRPDGRDGVVETLCEWVPGVHPPEQWKPHQELQHRAMRHMSLGWRMRPVQ